MISSVVALGLGGASNQHLSGMPFGLSPIALSQRARKGKGFLGAVVSMFTKPTVEVSKEQPTDDQPSTVTNDFNMEIVMATSNISIRFTKTQRPECSVEVL